MRIGSTEILDTHAEAFAAWYTRLVVTGSDIFFFRKPIETLCGYGTSVIGCDTEIGVESTIGSSLDSRLAVTVLCFAFNKKKLAKAVGNRAGQCILTCPTTACFNGLPDAKETIPLGDYVRYFGDGYEQKDDNYFGRAVWRIPVMDGEFIIERTAGVERGVAGGNIIIQAAHRGYGLEAARRAEYRLQSCRGIIAPFPGGACRSGSKVGSRYKNLVASTHEAYCPTLRDRVPSQLVDGANCAYEIVIDGVDEASVRVAMRTAIEAAAGEGVLAIGAGNYGGKLGKIPIRLHDLFAKS